MAKSLKRPLTDIEFAIVDIETTGFSHQFDKILEVAAIKIKNGEILGTYHSLIYTDYIPDYLTKYVHGIDVDMVKDAPQLPVVRKQFCKFVKGCVLVGHNIISFDSRFLRNHFKINENAHYVDTLKLSRAIFPGERYHSLGVVAKRLSIKKGMNHRALSDAHATTEVFLKLINLGKKRFDALRDLI
ncbi:MAG: exonuclease domain-containing protein [Candidatus Omnitrophota bacterium]